MRTARVHPMFVVMLLASLLCLGGAVVWAGSTSERCPGPGDSEVTATCAYESEGLRTGALALSIAGLAVMIGGVGFQVGRWAPQPPMPPPAAFPPGPPVGGPMPPRPQRPPGA